MTAQRAQRPRTARTNPATTSTKRPTALVLSAGAPNALLMAGALAYLWEHKKTFDAVYTTGGSAFLGLVYAAPKDKEPHVALRNLIDVLSVPDVVFRLFPMNYKVFAKAGPFTKPIRRLAERLKIPRAGTGQNGIRDFYNNAVDVAAAIITPTTVTPFSTGICEPFPFLDELVDFKKLKSYPGGFYMNAFNVTDGEMALFTKDEIDERHFFAALAYPFMYPPVEIDGKFYFEGAAHDPVNFGKLTDPQSRVQKDLRSLVLMDVLASLQKDIVRMPSDLWEAYGMSIMVPAVSLAAKCIELFEQVGNYRTCGEAFCREGGRLVRCDGPRPCHKIFDIHKIKFDIPAHVRPHIMDWSRSNLQALFEIGRAAGKEFLADKDNAGVLKDLP